MIVGIGTDLIEIGRIQKAYERKSFCNRVYTLAEQDMIGTNVSKAAGNFAVKEAVSKVFGTGIRGFELIDIEVLRDDMGKPYVNLLGTAKSIAASLSIHTIHVSITNTKQYAQAFAVGEGTNPLEK